MNFLKFLTEALLTEGGAALKNTEPLSQHEATEAIPGLVAKIAHELDIKKSQVRVVGSAGKKPEKTLSGDIDVVVKADVQTIEAALPKLASDGKSHRAMVGINVYSFAFKIGKKMVQVDLIPVSNIKFAEWSYLAHPEDLKSGLKGAHRNELFFAVTKHADLVKKDLDEDDEVDEIERYFYDLSRGLMRGVQSKRTGKGKLSKNFKTVSKNKVSDDPAEITKILFGPETAPGDVSTFEGTLQAILSPSFPYPQDRDAILKMAAKGIEKKGLTVPSSLAELA